MSNIDPIDVCMGKKPYARFENAIRVAELCAARRGDKLRVYLCEVCGAYHLTSQSADKYARKIEPRPDPNAGKWPKKGNT